MNDSTNADTPREGYMSEHTVKAFTEQLESLATGIA